MIIFILIYKPVSFKIRWLFIQMGSYWRAGFCRRMAKCGDNQSNLLLERNFFNGMLAKDSGVRVARKVFWHYPQRTIELYYIWARPQILHSLIKTIIAFQKWIRIERKSLTGQHGDKGFVGHVRLTGRIHIDGWNNRGNRIRNISV